VSTWTQAGGRAPRRCTGACRGSPEWHRPRGRQNRTSIGVPNRRRRIGAPVWPSSGRLWGGGGTWRGGLRLRDGIPPFAKGDSGPQFVYERPGLVWGRLMSLPWRTLPKRRAGKPAPRIKDLWSKLVAGLEIPKMVRILLVRLPGRLKPLPVSAIS
jgi:hypothetical protein